MRWRSLLRAHGRGAGVRPHDGAYAARPDLIRDRLRCSLPMRDLMLRVLRVASSQFVSLSSGCTLRDPSGG
jgi:hypothetical protein